MFGVYTKALSMVVQCFGTAPANFTRLGPSRQCSLTLYWAFIYPLRYFWASMHSPLSLEKGSSSTSQSESPCSSQWSVCSPAAVWGEWGETHSASATPSAPPVSGLTYTGPHTDTDPAPSTYSKDKQHAELMLNKEPTNKTTLKPVIIPSNGFPSCNHLEYQRFANCKFLYMELLH